jgi:hypothetical protein
VKLAKWEVKYDIPKPVRHSHSGRIPSQNPWFGKSCAEAYSGKDPCAGRLLIMEVRVEP